MSKYGSKFHNKRIGNPRYPKLAAAVLSTEKFSTLEYSSVIDVGCSVGALLGALKDSRSSLQLSGLEYDLEKEDTIYDGYFLKHDLNEHLDNWFDIPKSDLIICQEVLEHVEPENTASALYSLTAPAKDNATLIFGAAHPGQPGKHHVNCRLKEEWKSLLTDLGWKYNAEMTEAYLEELKKHGINKGCYIDNTMCFTKTGILHVRV